MLLHRFNVRPFSGSSTFAVTLLRSHLSPFYIVFPVGTFGHGMRSQSTDRKSKNDPTPSSLSFQSLSDWYTQFRWRAANLLTESLSDAERQDLFNRMNVSPKPSTEIVEKEETNNKLSTSTSHSIAEAVAEARAQEINKSHKELWEREKEKFMVGAENAARERIESDLLLQKRNLAFLQWKEDLEKSKIEENRAKAFGDVVISNEVASNRMNVPSVVNSVTPDPKDEQPPHPILGPCFLDIGYKRYHAVKAQALAAIPVWEKQRIYRHDRAKSMAVDKLKTMHLGVPGVIGLYEHSDGMLSILDGQHRVGMFTILLEESLKKDPKTSFLDQIVVEVYSSVGHDENHAKDIFLEINKAEPVRLVDMPGIAKGSDRKMLNEAVDRLYEDYREMFSTSTRCRPPHVNVDNVRDALFAANVIGRHKIKSSSQLLDWLVQQNRVLASKYKSGKANLESPGINAKVLEKAIKFQFYLGLESSWYYN